MMSLFQVLSALFRRRSQEGSMGCQRGAGPLVNLRFMGVYTILRVLSIPWNNLTECRRNCPERVSADDFDAVLVRRSLCAWDLLEGVPPGGYPYLRRLDSIIYIFMS